VIVDANLLLYAVDKSAQQHVAAREWLEESLNGQTQVGFPWPSLLAFVRISTHPRVSQRPLSGEDAWALVDDWLSAPTAWIPEPTAAHADVLGRLVRTYGLTGNLIPDGHLAALAIEHGVSLCSTDTDFGRFAEIDWINPIAQRKS
jgi:toxin-antitoxin system PIN domain toxin